MSNLTVESVVEMCRALGCDAEEQKSFWKITSPEKNRKALYIGKTKRGLTRVDVSGFEPEEHPAISPMTQEEAKSLKLGAVRGQIMTKTLAEDVDVEEGIRTAVRGLLSESEGFKLGKRAAEEEEEAEVSTEENAQQAG